MRVTVVLAAYNATWCIERALDSVMAQTRPADEVIVCDDGSTDGTADLVEDRYGDAVTVLRLPHRNAAAARRSGLECAQGDWLALLDADDRWVPAKLARQEAFLERHPEVRWLTSDGRYVSDEGVLRESWLGDYFDPVRDLTGDLLVPLLQRCFPLVSSGLVERHAYEAVGGLDAALAYSHDYDLWLRLAARYPGGVQAEGLVDYYTGPGTLSRNLEARFRDDLEVLRRVECSGLGRGRAVRCAAAARASALEFDLAIVEARAGRMADTRARLWRAARRGPWERRLVATSGALLPAWAFARLMRSSWIKERVKRSRRRAGQLALPAEDEAS